MKFSSDSQRKAVMAQMSGRDHAIRRSARRGAVVGGLLGTVVLPGIGTAAGAYIGYQHTKNKHLKRLGATGFGNPGSKHGSKSTHKAVD